MHLGGSGGGIVMFVLALLSALASLVECYSYYELIPKVQFIIDRQVYATIQGSYISYGPNTDFAKLLSVVDDPFFGCSTETNETDVPAYPTQSTFLLPDSSHCTISEKSSHLYSTYEARAVILYRLSDEASDEENRQRRQTTQRSSSQSSSGPTVIRLNMLTEQVTRLVTRQNAGGRLQVIVEAQLMQRGFRTTQTFYFVVFAFCILMLLSCSWLLLSYFRRCHYRWKIRRNQARSANETRQMVNRLPTKSYKSSKEKGEVPTCVVCLEVFKNHESIRILPCKHEFHKKCIDPWLKMKRTCPMCKQDIFPSKRRRQSSSDATTSGSQRNAARASSQDPTAVLVTTAASSHRLRRTRSWSDSSTSSGSSNSSTAASNTSATPLLGAGESRRSLGDGVVRPTVDELFVQEIEEEDGRDVDSVVVAVEMGESSSSQQQQQEQQSPREEEREGEGQNDHIGVEIEGPAGLVSHPAAPVANA